jgi:hypothetical protein
VTLRATAIGALIAAIGVGMISNVLFLVAFQFRLDWFLEPAMVVGAGATSAELLRWASTLDLIGYYLATGVLAYVLWVVLRDRNRVLADLATMGAVGYTLAGGTGAAVLAMVGPQLMHDHAAASGTAEQAIISAQFGILLEVVWRSIWQLLDGILLAAWWLGIGLLIRPEQQGLSRLSLALAGAATLGVACNLLGLDLGRDAALGVVFTLWTIWWIWLLLLFSHRRAPFV